MEIGTDGHELRGRTTVAEYDDSLALEIDTLIPLGRVNDPSLELGRVERCVGRVREGPDGTDKHVASLECRLVRLEIGKCRRAVVFGPCTDVNAALASGLYEGHNPHAQQQNRNAD